MPDVEHITSVEAVCVWSGWSELDVIIPIYRTSGKGEDVCVTIGREE